MPPRRISAWILKLARCHIHCQVSAFAGKTIETSRIRQDRGVIILAIKRRSGHAIQSLPLTTAFEPGDFLIAMGEPSQLRQLEQTAGVAAMKIVTAAEMRAIDRATSERFGVPSLTLMENAGAAVADYVLSHYAAGGAHRGFLRQRE